MLRSLTPQPARHAVPAALTPSPRHTYPKQAVARSDFAAPVARRVPPLPPWAAHPAVPHTSISPPHASPVQFNPAEGFAGVSPVPPSPAAGFASTTAGEGTVY